MKQKQFNELMEQYQKENESILYDWGVTLIRLGTFLMTAYLVITVINN